MKENAISSHFSCFPHPSPTSFLVHTCVSRERKNVIEPVCPMFLLTLFLFLFCVVISHPSLRLFLISLFLSTNTTLHVFSVPEMIENEKGASPLGSRSGGRRGP